jgi:hypothetical protein
MKSLRSIGAATLAFPRRRRAGWLCVLVGLLFVGVAAGAGLLSSRAQSQPDAHVPQAAAQSAATLPAQPLNTANAQGAPQPGQATMPAQPAASTDQQKQAVAGEAADLLKMATVLKSEVDKTTKDTLSVTVVRKAGEIEQLAHKVRTGPGPGKG